MLEGIDMGLEAVKFPLQGGEIVDGIEIMAELSSDSLVPHVEGPGDDCVMAGWVSNGIEEPLGILPIFVNGEALRGKELLAVDGLIHAICAQAVLSIKFD